MAGASDENRIFVGGLSYETEQVVIQNHFSQFGSIQDVRLVRYPPPDNRSKGFAFVTFESIEAKESALAQETHVIEGKTVELRQANSELARSNNTGRFAPPLDMENVSFRRLFVGNVDHGWADEVLEEYFTKYGELEDCTIKRGQDGKCLGFAFLTYRSAESVDLVQRSRPHSVEGRTVETRRQTAKQYVGTPEAKLEVDKIWIGTPDDEKGVKGHTGLGDSISDEDLTSYFSQFGTVIGVKQLMWPDTKKKRGYGYIEFDDSDAVDKVVISKIHVVKNVRLEAKKAVHKMPGQMDMMGFGLNFDSSLGGRGSRKRGADSMSMPMKKMKVEMRDPESEIMRRLFVGNINQSIQENDLEQHFSQFGTITKIVMKAGPNKSRGFAFIIYNKSEEVDVVLHNRPHIIKGVDLDCKRSTPKSEGIGMEERVKKIWIGKPDGEFKLGGAGLNDDTTDQALNEYFSQFGKVVNIHQFIWKDTLKKRGYGYITFDNEDVVDKVVLLGVHKVAGVNLQCKKAVSKDVLAAAEGKGKSMNHGGGNMAMMGSGSMQNIMSNMQSMMNQMPSASGSRENMMNMMGNMQDMVNQMNQFGAMDDNSNMMVMNMMNQMNQMNQNMMNSMMSQSGRGMGGGMIGGRFKSKDDDMHEQMMSMMTNMMSMMNNMVNMMQQGGSGNSSRTVGGSRMDNRGSFSGGSGRGNSGRYGGSGFGASGHQGGQGNFGGGNHFQGNNQTGGYGGNQMDFGGNQTSFGGNQSGFGGGGQSGYGGNQSGFGGNQSGYGGNQSGYGGNQSGYGGNQSGYGGNLSGVNSSQEGFNGRNLNLTGYGGGQMMAQSGRGRYGGGYANN